MTIERLPSSFRDPSGFLFHRQRALYRSVAPSYARHYDALVGGGLYHELTTAELLIPHEEAAPWDDETRAAHRILRPEVLPFVSYPYEWCFGELKAAALATLEIQQHALARGMILKDASAYNVQFRRGRPVLIDTLSFEIYQQGAPWVAYRQFCEHFLAPLMLMSRVHIDAGRFLREFLDGVPLEVAARMLGARASVSPSALIHIRLHAKSIRRFGDTNAATPRRLRSMSRRALGALVENLAAAVRGLEWRPRGTQWADYGQTHGYAPETLEAKHRIVADQLARARPAVVWDLGANTGDFSRLAVRSGASVIAFDADPAAVELSYQQVVAEGEPRLLPLLMDLANPSPSLGWDLRERMSLVDRGPADAILALALVHHLAISHNLPFDLIAQSLARLGRDLIIEYVPKSDPQAQRLLRSRADIFGAYDREAFERAFRLWFRVIECVDLPGSGRTIYWMARNSA